MSYRDPWWKKFIIPLIAFAIVLSLGWAVDKANADPNISTGTSGSVAGHKGDPPVQLNIDGPRADHRKCVTFGEWGRLYGGMPLKDVQLLLDGPGTKQTGNLSGYWYPMCGRSSYKARYIVYYDLGTLDGAVKMVFHGSGSHF